MVSGVVENRPKTESWFGSALHDGIDYRIVGFKKLREMLQPKHPYFEGSEGYIRDYSFYDDDLNYFCYPRIKVPSGSRKNPYRKTQLRAKHTSRTIKKLLALKESAGLSKFKVAVMGFTFPQGVSEWLSRQDGDSGMCWRLFNRFWNEDYATLDADSGGQAAYVNLHKWKTAEPVKPHYHFHTIVPNQRLIGELGVKKGEEFKDNPCPKCGCLEWYKGNGGYQCAGCSPQKSYEFKRKTWYVQRGGTEVPFSDKVTDELKRRWHSRLVNFATRHGIRDKVPVDWKKIDVFVEYVAWDYTIEDFRARLEKLLGWADDCEERGSSFPRQAELDELQNLDSAGVELYLQKQRDKGRAQLMNKVNYQSRHWLEDYALYSNKHPGCPAPPGWLERYNNNTRVFGWWKNLKSLTAGVDMDKKEKLSPFDGESMEYVGRLSLEELLDLSNGKIGTLEFDKGRPLFDDLSPEDLAWLREVAWKKPYPDDL